MSLNRKKIYLQLLAFFILILSTFGLAIYGILNQDDPQVIFKGSTYKEISYNTFVNKDNNHIYITELHDGENFTISMVIENDDAIITFENGLDNYTIEKDGLIVHGNFQELESESQYVLCDYVELIHSYHQYNSYMDEFPEILVFTFFALFPFIFGVLLIIGICKKREKASVSRMLFNIIFALLFISSYGLFVFVIIQNT